MPTDRITLNLTPAQLTAVDRAITSIETTLTELVALAPLERRRLKTMGRKSETFCRETLTVMQHNPQLVNPALGLEAATGDLEALDALRPRRQRIQRLLERMEDTEALLGGDVMAAALEAYGLLKVSGRAQGLTSLRQELGARFKAQGRRVNAANDDAAASGDAA